MKQVVDELRAAFPEREIVLRTEGDASGSWDGDRLAQIAHNLVTNALKYGCRSTPVLVTIRGNDERDVLLEVHNEGAPIPPALVPELFKPLSRGAAETGRTSGSIGLGLFIVDQLVRAHEGTIAVRSTESDGTTFTVRLPRAAAGADTSRVAYREKRVAFG
jgi:signal transduction histidine kinase